MPRGPFFTAMTWPVASVAADVKKSEAEPVPDTGSAEEGSVVATDQGSAGQAAATSAEGSATAAEKDEPKIEFDRHGLISTAPTDEEGAITEPITTSDGKVVGKVRLWVLGSDVLLTKTDTAFREKTIDAMFLAAAIAVAISVMIGLFVSRMLTSPIRRITGTAKQIRDGDLSARTNMRGDDEIDQLGETFDEMATSLEKDLKHERRLTSDVAHELRTPLMAMLATVEAMQDGVYPTDNEHLETGCIRDAPSGAPCAADA